MNADKSRHYRMKYEFSAYCCCTLQKCRSPANQIYPVVHVLVLLFLFLVNARLDCVGFRSRSPSVVLPADVDRVTRVSLSPADGSVR